MPSSTSRSTKKKTTIAPKKAVAKKAVAKPAVKAAAARKPASTPRATARKTTLAAPASPSPAFVLTHDVIAQRAHDLYVQSGYQGHRQEEFWLEAERQLRGGAKF